MRILYLSQYFYPEVGATQTRAYEMARHLVQAGHHVTMLCEFPNHPSGIIPQRYRGKLYERDDLEGIDILRVWVKASPEKRFGTRMLFYLSYMFSAILAGVFLVRGRYDAIYATSPPLFVGGAGWVLSHLRRTPLFFEVRDLWPASAIALGELTSQRAIAWATRLEEMCYNRATAIIPVAQGSKDKLIERGFPASKIALIPNGSNTDLFRPDPEAGQRIRRDLGLPSFVLAYAGTHGIAQGLEVVLRAAEMLQDQPDIHFLFIGEGPVKAELLAFKAQHQLDNVTMLAEQPMVDIPAYLSAANAALVPLRKTELFQHVVPSKIFDAWACACPVLLGVDGEARQLLETAQAGLFFEPENAEALAAAISRLHGQPERAVQMGRNGRRYVQANYSRQRMAERLERLLRAKCEQRNTL